MNEPPSYIGFNWRVGQPAVGESLWSVAHKFCWLNSVRGVALLKHFAHPSRRSNTFTHRVDGSGVRFLHDLRFEGALDGDRFASAILAPREWLRYCSYSGVSRNSLVRVWTVSFLRYCPTCIEQGFHSVLFQHRFERTCPIHDELLMDMCPQCGQRIPYSLPDASAQPYSCRCGRRLWWNIGQEEWPRCLNSDPFSTGIRRNLDVFRRLKPHARWQTDAPLGKVIGTSDRHWLEVVEDGTHREATPPQPAILCHYLAPGVRPVVRMHVSDVEYSILPDGDSELKEKIHEVYTRIERHIYRRFPHAKRKRWLKRTKQVPGLNSIGTERWSEDFTAYLLWKAYWLETSLANFPRGRGMAKQAPFKPQVSQVYWRYLQHVRRLRPGADFSAADEWAYLHHFAIVALATYRASQQLARTVQFWGRIYRAHSRGGLEKAILPFVVLTPKVGEAHWHELRIWP